MLYGVGFMARYIPWLKQWVRNKREVEVIGQFEEFLLVTRFLPGSRLPTYLYCGYRAYNPFKFGSILLFSTMFYALFGVFLLKTFNIKIHPDDPFLKKMVSSLFIALMTILSFKQLVKAYQYKKKYKEWLRPFLISYTRLRKLEFWNSWFLYLPFVPYFISLLFKYRGFGVCLNSNPAIFMSGLIGEKKSEIDQLLQKYLPQNSLPTRELPSTKDGLDQLSYPLVVKPNSGLRGVDVGFVESQAELEEYTMKSKKSLVVQEYCSYEREWGVFYIRYPGEDKGRIFSITDKRMPFVLGDGKSSLYQLVMQNEILKVRFDWLFADGGPERSLNPHFIPYENEKFFLTRKGSHSKGCLFYDGEEFLAEAGPIAAALDRIPGFYIGRADVKFDSLDALREGKFIVIEINGAAAESTNIYDPSFSSRKIYQTLAQQWKHIFAIGSQNTERESKEQNVFNLFYEIFSYKGIIKRES